MKLFLDTSVLLAACGSAKGASRYICEVGAGYGWQLMTSGYCRNECLRNLPKLGGAALSAWMNDVEPRVGVVSDVLALDKMLVFEKAKDRPVVVSALAAEAGILLTLDRADFHRTLGPQIYGMSIRTPAEFLMELRRIGKI